MGCEGYSPKVLLKKRPSSGVPITKNLKKVRENQIQWATFKPSKSTIDSRHIEALHYEEPELKPKSRRKIHYAFHRAKTENLNDLTSGRSKMDINGW